MILDFVHWFDNSEKIDDHQNYFWAEQFSHLILPLLTGREPANPHLIEMILGEAVAQETAQKIQWAAHILRNNAIHTYQPSDGQAIDAPDVEQPEPQEVKAAQEIFATDLLNIVTKFVRGRAGMDKRRQGNAEDAAQNFYVKALQQVTRPAKTKDAQGNVSYTWKELPEDFVGNVYMITRNEFSNTMKQTQQGPPSFSVGTNASIRAKIKQLNRRAKGQPPAVQMQIQNKIQQLKSYLDELESKGQGDMRRDIVNLGDPNAAAGWSGGKRRSGQDVGGDENDSAAQAIISSVDADSEDPGIGGVDDRPGSGGSRTEIPGQTDIRDHNWGLLHRALQDLAKMPSHSDDSNYRRYGMSKWELASLAIRIMYGIDVEYDQETKQIVSTPGQSMGNLNPMQDFARQRGTQARQDLRRGTQFSSTNLSPHKRSAEEPPEYSNLTIDGKGKARTMTATDLDNAKMPVQEAGFVAFQIARIIRSLAEAGELPEEFIKVQPPSISAVKNWVQEGMDYLAQWLLPPEKRQDWPKMRPRKSGNVPKFQGREVDPNTGKVPIGSVDYSNVNTAVKDLDRSQGMRQLFNKNRFKGGGLLGAEEE